MDHLFVKSIIGAIVLFVAMVLGQVFDIKTDAQRAKERMDSMKTQVNYRDAEIGMRAIAQDSDNTNSAIANSVYVYSLNDSMYYCTISVPYKTQNKTSMRTYKRLYNLNRDSFSVAKDVTSLCSPKKYAALKAALASDMKFAQSEVKD